MDPAPHFVCVSLASAVARVLFPRPSLHLEPPFHTSERRSVPCPVMEDHEPHNMNDQKQRPAMQTAVARAITLVLVAARELALRQNHCSFPFNTSGFFPCVGVPVVFCSFPYCGRRTLMSRFTGRYFMRDLTRHSKSFETALSAS